MRHSVFDDCAKGIGSCAFWQRELVVPVLHTFGSDHYDVEFYAGEYVGELEPDVSGEGGFGTGAEDEDADWRWVWTEAFDIGAGTCSRWVEGISKGWRY
jgi:hypothetical protein